MLLSLIKGRRFLNLRIIKFRPEIKLKGVKSYEKIQIIFERDFAAGNFCEH